MLSFTGKRVFCSRCYITKRCMATAFQDQKFGGYHIHRDEQFAQTALSFAFVNLKPIVRGHVLISPKRPTPRFADLTKEEVSDIWLLAQQIGKVLESNLKADALTLAIQDGPAAGQTVAHVHIHCLPRRHGDFNRNDDVYEALDSPDNSQEIRGEKFDMDAPRKSRSTEEMRNEAFEFRSWMPPTQ